MSINFRHFLEIILDIILHDSVARACYQNEPTKNPSSHRCWFCEDEEEEKKASRAFLVIQGPKLGSTRREKNSGGMK
jgi:hypothetical protein